MEIKRPDLSKITIHGHRVFAKHSELLNKYFTLDEEKRLATVKLRYDHFTDMLAPNIGEGKNRFFLKSVTDEMTEVLNLIPIDYQVNLIFEVKDYGPYSEEEAMGIAEDNLNFNYYQGKLQMKKKTRTALILFVIGILFLVFNILAVSMKWGHGALDTDSKGIISEVLDIAAWVFIWESVSIYFFDRSEIRLRQSNFRYRIKDIQFTSPAETHPESKADISSPEVPGKADSDSVHK
jgi:hypothetical protein